MRLSLATPDAEARHSAFGERRSKRARTPAVDIPAGVTLDPTEATGETRMQDVPSSVRATISADIPSVSSGNTGAPLSTDEVPIDEGSAM